MKTITVKLAPGLAAWLSQQSEQAGRSQSEIVREALEQQRLGQTKAPSCRELLAELDGFFDGPPDLSTNPQYLAEFGKSETLHPSKTATAVA